jgi:hypothetical protein
VPKVGHGTGLEPAVLGTAFGPSLDLAGHIAPVMGIGVAEQLGRQGRLQALLTLVAAGPGEEYLERYERLDDASKPGYAEIRRTGTTIGSAGVVDLVPPWAIHAEQGGAGRSCAVIIRSERLVGKVLQHNYDPATNSVVERSGPEQIPYPLTV